MALMAHRIETALDVPELRPSLIRIKNKFVGTVVARHYQYPHYPLAKYRVRLPDNGTIDLVSVPETEQCEELDIGQQVTLEVPPAMSCSVLHDGSAFWKITAGPPAWFSRPTEDSTPCWC
jgi:hypothetical protein